MRARALTLLCFGVLGGAAYACGVSTNNVCDYPGACPGDGSTDSSTDSSTCDPKTNTCIDDAKGIFVDSHGSDSAAGTRSAPVATIGKALALAKAGSKPNVYVCAGSYAENVAITSAVQVYGGLSCADWTYSASNVVTVDPATGLPLHVTSATASVSDVKFVAADGVNPGDSSIAAFVDTSTVTFLRDNLTAGKGVSGAAGVTGSNYTTITQDNAGIVGFDADGGVGGGRHNCTLCVDGVNSSGGPGGNGDVVSPTAGGAGLPNLSGTAPKDGVGGVAATTAPTACGNGDVGASGDAGGAASSTNVVGTLDATGWSAAVGTKGANGGVAQGGGGGGGGVSATKGGAGGGGCGGCGGAGGTGGGGGGASIGLLAFNSSVTFTASEIHAANAGDGGIGAAGQSGQPGGYGGLQSPPGCGGGGGGTGGQGGSGSGGAGGVSAGIVWKGASAPTADAVTTSNTTFGTKGNKGTGGTTVNDGPDGVAQAVLQAP